MAMPKPKYLVCVNPKYNNNKKYELIPIDSYNFKAVWSRIADESDPIYGEDSKVYPAYMWKIKYAEKIAKGYRDISHIHYGKDGTEAGKTTVKMKSEYKEIENKDVNDVVSYLLSCSRQIVAKSYTVTTAQVTEEMIKEGRRLLSVLGKRKTVDAFNKVLVKLFTAIPRRMGRVSDFLVRSVSEFSDKIDYETNLLDILESQCDIDKKTVADKKDGEKTILQAYGVHMWPATDKQLTEIKERLSDGMRKRLRKAYRVINDRTQKTFDDYLKAEKIKTVKMMFHGSRDENWLSIMLKGLSLNPDAVITGKMFGHGLYFSPDADKSWGYTSGYGTRWAHGNKSVAYLGLFALAYGKPYNVYNGADTGLNESRFKALHPGCNCLHAHGGQNLRKDEVIVYSEKAETICYLLEMDA